MNSTANVSYPGAPDLDATLLNISDSGTLITTQSRELGEGKVYFEFALPGQGQLVRLSGEVAWQDSSGRAGIHFLDVPQASRKLIQAWLQHNGPRPGQAATEPLIERFALEPKPEGAKGSAHSSAHGPGARVEMRATGGGRARALPVGGDGESGRYEHSQSLLAFRSQ